jgi:hypothetical protein
LLSSSQASKAGSRALIPFMLNDAIFINPK